MFNWAHINRFTFLSLKFSFGYPLDHLFRQIRLILFYLEFHSYDLFYPNSDRKIWFERFFFEINLRKIAVAVGEKGVVAAGKKTAIKTVRFSKNLNKLFPKADEISNNQRIDDNRSEITLQNTQTMSKELNDKKVAEENIFSEGNDGGNELKFHVMLYIGILNDSNEHF